MNPMHRLERRSGLPRMPGLTVTTITALCISAALCLTLLAAAWAGPGAHGPNGEHLDTPAGAAAHAAAYPRLVTHTDLVEVVAELRDGQLQLWVDWYDSNEPVQQARLELESGTLKAQARWQAEQGIYVIDAPDLIRALSTQGEHALVITLTQTTPTALNDLVDGVLVVGSAAAGQTPTASTPLSLRPGALADKLMHAASPGLMLAAGLAAVAVLALAASRRRRRHQGTTDATTRTSVKSHALILAPALALALAGVAAASAWAGPGAHGPNGEHLDDPGPTASSPQALARLPDGSVQVPKQAQRRMALRTERVSARHAAVSLELPGRVIADPNGMGRVQVVYGGRIEPGPQGLPLPGQQVRQGQVLGYVRHQADPLARGNQQAELAALRAQRQIAEQRLARLEHLEGTVPRKDIDAARTELQGLQQRERSLGSSLNDRQPLVAPVNGVVSRSDLIAGQVVEPRDVLVEIIDPARLMIEITTADPGLPAQIAEASLRDHPGLTLRLRGASQTLRDGVLPVLLSVQALPSRPTGQRSVLAVGQPVQVIVQRRERQRGIVLPAQAIARNAANEPVVWIKSGVERYIPQVVRHTPLDANNVLITQGLSDDNRVVVQGAGLLAQIR